MLPSQCTCSELNTLCSSSFLPHRSRSRSPRGRNEGFHGGNERSKLEQRELEQRGLPRWERELEQAGPNNGRGDERSFSQRPPQQQRPARGPGSRPEACRHGPYCARHRAGVCMFQHPAINVELQAKLDIASKELARVQGELVRAKHQSSMFETQERRSREELAECKAQHRLERQDLSSELRAARGALTSAEAQEQSDKETRRALEAKLARAQEQEQEQGRDPFENTSLLETLLESQVEAAEAEKHEAQQREAGQTKERLKLRRLLDGVTAERDEARRQRDELLTKAESSALAAEHAADDDAFSQKVESWEAMFSLSHEADDPYALPAFMPATSLETQRLQQAEEAMQKLEGELRWYKSMLGVAATAVYAATTREGQARAALSSLLPGGGGELVELSPEMAREQADARLQHLLQNFEERSRSLCAKAHSPAAALHCFNAPRYARPGACADSQSAKHNADHEKEYNAEDMEAQGQGGRRSRTLPLVRPPCLRSRDQTSAGVR